MARTIDAEVAKVRNAAYGADVREAIASSMEKTYDACETFKTESASSASQAKTSAGSAATSAKNAGDAAAAADKSAGDAKTSAGSAATSAKSAADAAENAKTYSSNSAYNANAAANAAQRAKESEDKAEEYAEAARKHGSLYYGVCETGIDEIIKTVTVDESFVLETGVTISVGFKHGVKPAVLSVLNVNGTGPISVGSDIADISTGYLGLECKEGQVLDFVFSGISWIRKNGTKADQNIWGITKLSSAVDSDSEQYAATPLAVKTAYDKAVEAQKAIEDMKAYVADKKTLDKIYDILMEDRVYGFIEHNAILAPGERIEYIGLNKDYTPLTVTMGGGYSLGSWADFPWLKANKPWMVHSDGTPDYQLDENDYTKRADGGESDVENPDYDGGAFAWAQKIYKREYMVGDDRYVLFSFEKGGSFEPVGFVDPDGNELEGAWIPMFFGSIVSEKMTSISGVQPEYSNTTATQKAAIDAVGDRAHFFGGSIVNTLIDLMIMFAKTTNLQSAYGYGNRGGYDSSQSPTMGVLKNAVVGGGQFYGTNTGNALNKVFHSVILTGGNILCRDPYTLCLNGRFKVSPNYKYSLTGEGYLDTGIDVSQPETAGYAYPHKYQTVPGFGHLPVPPYGGSTSTGGCDGIYRSASQATLAAVVLRFGACYNTDALGARSMYLSSTATTASWDDGSALLLLPPVGVAVE